MSFSCSLGIQESTKENGYDSHKNSTLYDLLKVSKSFLQDHEFNSHIEEPDQARGTRTLLLDN